MRQRSSSGRGTPSIVQEVERPSSPALRTGIPADFQRLAEPDFKAFSGQGNRLEQDVENNIGILCEKCGKKVPAGSMAIHQARCGYKMRFKSMPTPDAQAEGGLLEKSGTTTVLLPAEDALPLLTLKIKHPPTADLMDLSGQVPSGGMQRFSMPAEPVHRVMETADGKPLVLEAQDAAVKREWRTVINERGEEYQEWWATDADGRRYGEKTGVDYHGSGGKYTERWHEGRCGWGGTAGEKTGSNEAGDTWGEKWGQNDNGETWGEKWFTNARSGEKLVDRWASSANGEKWGEKQTVDAGGHVTRWEKWYEKHADGALQEKLIEKWAESADGHKWGEKAGEKAEGGVRWTEEWHEGPIENWVNKWSTDATGQSETEKKGSKPNGEEWHQRSGVKADGEKWTDNVGKNAEGDEWVEKGVEKDNVKWCHKYGKNPRGDVWDEEWSDTTSPDGTVEKQCRKSGTNPNGDTWKEEWQEHFRADGSVIEKHCHKIGSNAAGEHWDEEWREQFYANGNASNKICHKKAGNANGEHWEESWGESWREDASPIEKWTSRWAQDPSGRWGRNWGGRDLGYGNYHKWGDIWHDDIVDNCWSYDTNEPFSY